MSECPSKPGKTPLSRVDAITIGLEEAARALVDAALESLVRDRASEALAAVRAATAALDTARAAAASSPAAALEPIDAALRDADASIRRLVASARTRVTVVVGEAQGRPHLELQIVGHFRERARGGDGLLTQALGAGSAPFLAAHALATKAGGELIRVTDPAGHLALRLSFSRPQQRRRRSRRNRVAPGSSRSTTNRCSWSLISG
jgi:hypothetical protein